MEKTKITQIWSEPDFKGGRFIIKYKYVADDEVHYAKDYFQPYFYYPIERIEDLKEFIILKKVEIEQDSDSESKSIFNDKLIKVYIKKLNFRYTLLGRNKKRTPSETLIKHNSFMLDMQPELIYLLEHNNLSWSTERHQLYFDIETWFDLKSPSSNKPLFAQQPVTSIQLYSNIAQEYYVLVWHESFTEDIIQEKLITDHNETVNIIKCKNEQLLFSTFIKLFKLMNPDVITGWYSNGYDVPYLINRAKMIGMEHEFKSISPAGYVSTRFNSKKNIFYNTIKAVDHIDLMEAVATLNIKLPDNKLDTAAEIIIGEDMKKIKSSTWKDWKVDLDGFIKYGIRDVEILKNIDNKLDILKTFYVLQDMSNIIELKNRFSMTVMIDRLLTSLFFDDKTKIFPTDNMKEVPSFMGAFVKLPVVIGVHRNVAIFDYASLYPTSMMRLNLSPETFIISHTIAEKNGVDIDKDIIPALNKKGIKFIDTGYSNELVEKRYLFMSHETKVGIIPIALRKLYTYRKSLKKQMKAKNIDAETYKLLDIKQYVVKIFLNSIYGAFGSKYFRLTNFRLSDMTTWGGRKLIHTAERYFEGSISGTKMAKYLDDKYGKIPEHIKRKFKII